MLLAFSVTHETPAHACCGGQSLASTLFENSQVSGGVDGRGYWREFERPSAELYGVFLNFRKIFSDDLGDRWILSLQGDAEHDLKEIRSYQSFLQYKGPLGKWNVRAGHFILPFGLLNDLDTERLLLQSNEEETVGVKLDTGVSVFGFVEDWNWALSLTSGLGRRWVSRYKDTYLSTIRVSRKLEELTLGGSILIGEVMPDEDFAIQGEKVREQKIALDALYDFGQWVARLELLFGQEEGNSMGGAQGFFDYRLSSLWELNFKGGSILRRESEHDIGAGVSFRPWAGWVFRAADLYRFERERNENEFKIQVAYEFSRGL
jgi:hypothetical protein